MSRFKIEKIILYNHKKKKRLTGKGPKSIWLNLVSSDERRMRSEREWYTASLNIVCSFQATDPWNLFTNPGYTAEYGRRVWKRTWANFISTKPLSSYIYSPLFSSLTLEEKYHLKGHFDSIEDLLAQSNR